MTRKNPQVDAFLRKTPKWRKEFEALRKILLASPLDEAIKWRLPCYTLGESNIAIMQGFKDYCAVMFFKGALLKDPRGILVAPGASQAGRQARFTDVREIVAQERTLKAYIAEAIQVEKTGLEVTLKKTSDYKIPAEFQSRLDKSPALKAAFRALTPGRQRAYLFYFAQAKQSSTRAARVDKAAPRILKGKGLTD
jgi:uncharacterized protein YdeI (YjbR/CyaY-like superfamily)